MESSFDGVPAASVPSAFLDETFDLQGEFKGEKEVESEKVEGLPSLDELVAAEEKDDETVSSGREAEDEEEKALESKSAQDVFDETRRA